MKKKFIIFGIVMLLVTALFSVNVYAADADTITSATITITPSKTEYTAGETVEFIVSLKDLNASSGILGLGAYVSYDSNLLTLNKSAEGLTGWSQADISEKNRFLTYKNTHSSNNEDMIKISFTAKDVTSDVTTSVGLKQVQISNSVEYRINEVNSDTITIKPKSNSQENPPADSSDQSNPNDQNNQNTPNGSGQTGNDNGNNNNNNNNNNNDNNNDDIILFDNSSTNKDTNSSKNSNSNIPDLGVNGYISIVIAIAMIIAVISIIRIKMLDKKIRIEQQDISDKK